MRFEPATIIWWYIIAVISWIPIAKHLDRRHRGILVTPLLALPDHHLATPPILQPIPPTILGHACAHNDDHVCLPRERCWLDRSSSKTDSASARGLRMPSTSPTPGAAPSIPKRHAARALPGTQRGSSALSASYNVTAVVSRNFQDCLYSRSVSRRKTSRIPNSRIAGSQLFKLRFLHLFRDKFMNMLLCGQNKISSSGIDRLRWGYG